MTSQFPAFLITVNVISQIWQKETYQFMLLKRMQSTREHEKNLQLWKLFLTNLLFKSTKKKTWIINLAEQRVLVCKD